MTLDFPNLYPAVDRHQMDDLMDAALGLQGVTTTADRLAHHVEHPALTEADRGRVQAVIDAYVFDPLYGAAPSVKTLEERVAALEATRIR